MVFSISLGLSPFLKTEPTSAAVEQLLLSWATI